MRLRLMRRLLALLDAKRIGYRVEYTDIIEGTATATADADDDATSAQSPEASAALPQLLVGPLCFDYDSLQELEDLGRFDAVFRMVPSVGKSVSHPALS